MRKKFILLLLIGIMITCWQVKTTYAEVVIKVRALNPLNSKETAVINSNKMLRQPSSRANQENKFGKIAKNVSKMNRKDLLTKGIKPSYKK